MGRVSIGCNLDGEYKAHSKADNQQNRAFTCRVQETHSKYIVPLSFFVPFGVLVPVPPNCPLEANSLLVVDIGVFARDAV